MKQEDIDKKLIKHIFKNKELGTKKVLKEFCLKDIDNSKINTVENYFLLYLPIAIVGLKIRQKLEQHLFLQLIPFAKNNELL